VGQTIVLHRLPRGWQPASTVQADGQGQIQLPPFPGGLEVAGTDWAAKVKARMEHGDLAIW